MFAPEQIVRVFSVSLIHLLIVVYMNFKNIRRTNKENILLFTLLY